MKLFQVGLPVIIFLTSLVCCRHPQENEKQAASLQTTSADPLPSWEEGPVKNAILDFINVTTDSSSTDFVRPADRIAVFDNDGTLWSEQPVYFQLQFALDRIREMAPQHPEWEKNKILNAVLANDMKTVLSSGTKGLLEIVMTSHAGLTTKEFEQIVKDWIRTAKHPKTGRLYKEMVFQPMLEVLAWFQANGFKTYIVSGGGVEFLRAWAQEVYGIPTDQVIGSSIKTIFEMTNDGPVLKRLPEIDFIDDKEGKPVAINKFIGRRPVAAFGNSDGDLQMFQWTEANDGKKLMMIVHHTDAEREWAYDRSSHIGQLNIALDEANNKGWLVADMKKDWKKIYPWQ